MFDVSKVSIKKKMATALVAASLASHLILVLIQSSMVSDLLIPSILLQDNWIHVALLSIPLLVTLATGLWIKQSRLWKSAVSLSLVYAAIVLFSSAHLSGDNLSWSQIFLTPLTILSLAFCAPLLIRGKFYRLIFFTLTGILVLNSLLTFYFMTNGIEYFHGRSVIDGPGRIKDMFGFILPHTDGLYSNPNAIGSFLMYFPAIILSEVFALGFSLSMIGTLPCLSILTAALALTFSRGAQLTVLFGLLFPAISLRKYSTRLACFASAILILLSFIVSTSHTEIAPAKSFENVIQSKSYEKLLSGRMEIWQNVNNKRSTTSIIGSGLLNNNYDSIDTGNSPHNFILANFIYFGISGVLTIFAILTLLAIQIARRIKKHRPLIPIAGILVAACLIHGQVEYVITHPLYFSNSLFWTLLGYACFADIESSGKMKSSDKNIAEREQTVLA